MSSRAAMLFLLCVTLLFLLAACAPAIKTDESTWADAITLGTTESTASTTMSTETTGSTGSSTSGSTKSSASSVTTTTAKTTSRSSATTTSKTTTKTTGATTGTTVNADISVGYVNASTLHVRKGPGSSYESIGGLQRGDQVSITGRSGDWYVIRFGDVEAYVSAQYISSTPVE